MTVVELFDVSPLQNLSGVLTVPADTVYFVGSNYKKMVSRKSVYEKVFLRLGINAEIRIVSIPKYDINFAVKKLCEIAESDDDVIFDVSGGDDYILASAGIAAEKCFSKGVNVQHFSVRSQKYVCFGNDCFKPDINGRAELTADEVIELHGGKIVYADQKRSGTVIWDFESDGFADDLERMWELCRWDCRSWNRNSSRMGELENFAHGNIKVSNKANLNVSISKKDANTRGKAQLITDLKKHLDEISAHGLIKEYENNSQILRFCFKNEQIRQCLLKAGNVLELISCIAAKNTKNKMGKHVYNDVLCGVVLDWDSVIHTGNASVYDTENEIDGLYIKGMVPVFVSCKNGGVDENELYKLSSVAGKFGIKYAKKVLVATDLQKNYSSLQRFYARASQMGVQVIDGVHKMTFEELTRKLASV